VRPWLRYLRIVVSGLSLIGSLLLAVLWVRSYWRYDWIAGPLLGSNFNLHSECGATLVEAEELQWRKTWIRRTDGFMPRNYGQHVGWSLNPYVHRPLAIHATELGHAVWVPYWLPTYALGAIGFATSIRWPPRFNLRTAFILIAIVSVLAGIAVLSIGPPGATGVPPL